MCTSLLLRTICLWSVHFNAMLWDCVAAYLDVCDSSIHCTVYSNEYIPLNAVAVLFQAAVTWLRKWTAPHAITPLWLRYANKLVSLSPVVVDMWTGTDFSCSRHVDKEWCKLWLSCGQGVVWVMVVIAQGVTWVVAVMWTGRSLSYGCHVDME